MRKRLITLLAGVSLLSVSALGAVPAGASTVGPFTNGLFANTNNTYVVTGGSSAAGYDTLYASTPSQASAIPGWTVTSGNVDWINGYWAGPTTGDPWSIDMNGTGAAGSVAQTFSTDPNATYTVQFYLSGNTACGSTSQTVSLGATGTAPTSYTTGNDVYSSAWSAKDYSFVATSSSTTLTFQADPNNTTNCGPVIAAVSLTETAATGAMCKNGGWSGMYNGSGMLFKNQGACVSYYATNGDTPIGS